jgi:hypothetical protein
VAAVVAVVGGLGVGGGIVFTRQSGTHSSTAHSDGTAAGAPKAANGGGAGASSYGAAGCPATLPQDNTRGPAPSPTATFFTRPVASIVVCAYSAGGAVVVGTDGTVISELFDSAGAAALAGSIEHASTTLLARPCPLYRTNQPTLLMIPTATDGTALPDVTTTVLQNPCNASITNGSAERYNWTPPALLQAFVARLAQAQQTPATSGPSHS